MKINFSYSFLITLSFFLVVTTNVFSQLNIDSLKFILKRATDIPKKSQTCIDISWEYMLKENDSSLFYSEKGYKISEQNNYYFGMITNLEMKGIYLESVINNYTNASKAYVDAIKIAEKHNEKYISSLFMSLGTLFNEIGDKDKAKEYYKLASMNAKRYKQDILVKLSLVNLGSIYSFEENYPLALKILNESLTYKSHDNYNNHVTYFNIAGIYKSLKQYKKAEEFYIKSLGKYSSKKNDIRYHDHYSKLLETKILNNNLNGIDTLISSSEYFLNKIQSPIKKINLLNTLSTIYKNKGDYKKSLFYKEVYLKNYDSITKNKRENIIYDIEQRYQNKKKQLELEKKDAELNKQKLLGITLGILTSLLLILLFFVKKANKFKRLNEYNLIQKNKLEIEQQVLRHQMNPHFIFNALNSIQSYVSDNNTTDAETYLAKFSRLIRLILENSRKEFVPFKEDYFALDVYLKLEQNRFDDSFSYNIIYDSNINDVKIPPMLVQPFVENSIKHGISKIKEQGEITILFKITENIEKTDKLFGVITCIIKDNGIGIEKAKQNTKNSNIKHNSISLILVKKRLKNYTKSSHKDYLIKTTQNSPRGTIAALEMPYII